LNATIAVRAKRLTGPVIISSCTLKAPGGIEYEGSINGKATTSPRQSARSIAFHLVSFHGFIGDPIQYSDLFMRGRLTLEAHGWRVTVDQQPPVDLGKKLRSRGGYAITHAGTITRKTNAAIAAKSAEDHLTTLHSFLAFCRGAWCGPMLID